MDGRNIKIEGKWNDSLVMEDCDTGESFILWKANPRPEDSPYLHSFTNFALQLNQLTDDFKRRVAPTDSRLRPD